MTDLPSSAPAGSPPLEPLDSGDASRLREIAEDLDAYEHGPTWRGDRDYLRELATRVSQLSALREENERLKKQIAILEAPDICGRNEDTFYEQDDFDGLAEIPNEIVGVDWANRVIDGEWRAVNLVTAWDEDGDADEWEIRLFRSDADAKAAIAESLAKRAAISSPPLDRERSNG